MTQCYCGSQVSFEKCCEPILNGTQKASTAEILMRSRYSAYATGNADYLIETTHPSTRKLYNKKDILEWSLNNHWIKLEILASTEITVTFNAYYLDSQLTAQKHYEHSLFMFENGCWFYVEGTYQ